MFQKLLTENELDISRARSKVYARVSRFDSLYDGEKYDVDLENAWFNGTVIEGALSGGPLQILGTWHDGEFMWAWLNSSIPEQSYQQARSFIQDHAPLAPFVDKNPRKFECTYEDAERLAQYVAIQMGMVGAFEAPNNEAVAFLLLDLSPIAESGEPNGNRIWCVFCGRTNAEVARVYAASTDCHICDVCVADHREIAEMDATGELDATRDASTRVTTSTESGVDAEFNAKLPPCLLCGERGKRTFTKYGAFCRECAAWEGFSQ